jgi:hypothetical protein
MRKSVVKKKKSELKRSYPELKKTSGIVLYTSRSAEHHAVYFHNTMQEGVYDCGFRDENPILTQAHPTIEEALKKMCKVIAVYGLDIDVAHEKYSDTYLLYDEMMTYIKDHDQGRLEIIENIE